MDCNELNDLQTNMHEFRTNLINVNIKRAELGFVNTDCDYVKTMLTTICLHSLENPLILKCGRMTKIVELIKELTDESET